MTNARNERLIKTQDRLFCGYLDLGFSRAEALAISSNDVVRMVRRALNAGADLDDLFGLPRGVLSEVARTTKPSGRAAILKTYGKRPSPVARWEAA